MTEIQVVLGELTAEQLQAIDSSPGTGPFARQSDVEAVEEQGSANTAAIADLQRRQSLLDLQAIQRGGTTGSPIVRNFGSATISTINGNGTIVAINAPNHGFSTGDRAIIDGTVNYDDDGIVTVTAIDVDNLTYPDPESDRATETLGTIRHIGVSVADANVYAIGQRLRVPNDVGGLHKQKIVARDLVANILILEGAAPPDWTLGSGRMATAQDHWASVPDVETDLAADAIDYSNGEAATLPKTINIISRNIIYARASGLKAGLEPHEVDDALDDFVGRLLQTGKGTGVIDGGVWEKRRPMVLETGNIKLEFHQEAELKQWHGDGAFVGDGTPLVVGSVSSTTGPTALGVKQTLPASFSSPILPGDGLRVLLDNGSYYFGVVESYSGSVVTFTLASGRIPSGRTANNGANINYSWVSRPLLYIGSATAPDLENITITGGIWDGQKAQNVGARGFGIHAQYGVEGLVLAHMLGRNFAAESTSGGNGGDFITIGGSGDPITNFTIEGIRGEANVRQVISVVKAIGGRINSPTCIGTSGSNPGAGIDCEPDVEGSPVENITISQGIFDDCNHAVIATQNAVNITVQDTIRAVGTRNSVFYMNGDRCKVYRNKDIRISTQFGLESIGAEFLDAKDNEFLAAGGATSGGGVRLVLAYYPTIEDNEFISLVSYGVLVDDRVTQDQIDDAGHAASNRVKINDNLFHRCLNPTLAPNAGVGVITFRQNSSAPTTTIVNTILKNNEFYEDRTPTQTTYGIYYGDNINATQRAGWDRDGNRFLGSFYTTYSGRVSGSASESGTLEHTEYQTARELRRRYKAAVLTSWTNLTGGQIPAYGQSEHSITFPGYELGDEIRVTASQKPGDNIRVNGEGVSNGNINLVALNNANSAKTLNQTRDYEVVVTKRAGK